MSIILNLTSLKIIGVDISTQPLTIYNTVKNKRKIIRGKVYKSSSPLSFTALNLKRECSLSEKYVIEQHQHVSTFLREVFGSQVTRQLKRISTA